MWLGFGSGIPTSDISCRYTLPNDSHLVARASEVQKREKELKDQEAKIERDRQVLSEMMVDVARKQAQIERDRQALVSDGVAKQSPVLLGR